MLRMLIALILSAVVVLVSGPKVIPALRRLKFGQTIYDLGPQSHKTKQGTPVMGGVMIFGGTVLAAVLCTIGTPAWGFMLPLVLMSAGTMAVGFTDDYVKVVKKRSEGLTPKQKIVLQMVVCVAFSVYCYCHPHIGSKIIIPFVNVEWDLGIFYIPLLSLTILFMTNSANLQDGVDGILSTVTAVGNVAWAGIAVMFMTAVAATDAVLAAEYQSVAIYAMALCGGCIGFLRFNRHPAKVFMGDTGSEYIGGAVAGMAMLLRQPALLLLIAFTMVASSVSVILQRYYYKATRKIYGEPHRLFKMTPIHHHFELSGYKETQIVKGYGICTAILSLVAILSVIGLKLV